MYSDSNFAPHCKASRSDHSLHNGQDGHPNGNSAHSLGILREPV